MADQSETFDWLRSQVHTVDDPRLTLRDRTGSLTPMALASQRELDGGTYTFELTKTTNRHRLSLEEENAIQHTEHHHYCFTLEGDWNSTPVELVFERPAAELGAESVPETPLTVTTADLRELVASPAVQTVPTGRAVGLQRQQRTLRRVLRTNPTEWGLSPQPGLLLCGPPGVGKSDLVTETCHTLFGRPPVTVSGHELAAELSHGSDRSLATAFGNTPERYAPVVFLDHIDAVAPTQRDSSLYPTDLARSKLLDALEDRPKDAPTIVGSTTLADRLDPRLLDRFGEPVVTLPRPNADARQVLFHRFLERIRTSERGRLGSELSGAVTDPLGSSVLEELATATAGYTGADIEAVMLDAVSTLTTDGGREHEPEPERDPPILEATDIHQQIDACEGQLTGPSVTETRITADIDHSVQVDGDGQVAHLEGPATRDELNAIAFGWHQHVDHDGEFRLRTVATPTLLGSTASDTRHRVGTAFQHDSETRLCLYLADFPSVARAGGHTSLANAVVESVHEELLRWDDRNLLLYEADGVTLEDGDRKRDRTADTLPVAAPTLEVSMETDERDTVPVEELATQCWESLNVQTGKLTVTKPFTLTGDRTRLKLLFENLFQHCLERADSKPSIRIGPMTAIHVSTRVDDKTAPYGFYLEDDGPPLAASQRDIISKRDEPTDLNGTDFSLAIVRKAVDAHDWSISVAESTVDGTRFEIVGVGSEGSG